MRHRQQGMSIIMLLLVIGLVGLIAKFGIAIIPAYMDYMTLDKTIKAMMRETQVDSQTPSDVQRALLSRFQVNNIPEKMLDSLKVTKEGNVTSIALDYEVRQPFLGNVDVIVHFQHNYSSDKPGIE